MNRTVELSICIVTRNRREDVTVAVESALAQGSISTEVRVYDNGSEDGTAETLEKHFREAVIRRLETNRGACFARNLALREAAADMVFFMDDDSYFTAPDTASAAVEYLRAHPRTAAVGLPFVEPKSRGMAIWTPPPEYERTGACAVRSVVTCACAVRRGAALDVGGFRDTFYQWGEERDFCIRLMQKGFDIAFIKAPTMVHKGSAARDIEAMQYLGIRNRLLFDVLNVPMPWVLAVLLGDSMRLWVHKLTLGNSARRFFWVWRGLLDALRRWRNRAPVSASVYRQYRTRPGHGPIAVLDVLPLPLTRARLSSR